MGAILNQTYQESGMNWDRIEGNWKQLKGSVQQQWGMLTDDQLEVAAGRCVLLSGRVQESYGISKEVTEKQLAARQVSQK